ncbi:hypothetical protein ACVI1K_008316 [Bradyrhizobium sp. USDA 4508]
MSKGLGRRAVVKAFARGVVVGGDELAESGGREGYEIRLAGNKAAHPADGVLDATLLPGGMGIAEEGRDREAVQRQVTGELGAVVEGNALAQLLWKGREEAHEMAGDTARDLAGKADAEQQPRGALMHGQHGLTVFREHHQVGLPVSGHAAVGRFERPICQGYTAFDEACGAAAPLAAAAALALGARQIAPPVEVRGAPELAIDEAVDGLVGDHLAPVLAGQPASDLLGRPAAAKALQHRAAQAGLPFEASARPAPRSHLVLGIARLVADLAPPIAPQFPRDR